MIYLFFSFASAVNDTDHFLRMPYIFQSHKMPDGSLLVLEPENYETIRTQLPKIFFRPVVEFAQYTLNQSEIKLKVLLNLLHTSPKILKRFSVEMLLHGVNKGDLLSVRALIENVDDDIIFGLFPHERLRLSLLELERKLLSERICVNADEPSIQSEQVAVTFSQFSKVGLRYLNDIYNGVRPSEKDIQDLYRRLPFLVQCTILGGKKSFNAHLKRFGIHPLPSYRVTPELKAKMQELRCTKKYTLEGISNVTGFSISTVRRHTKPFEEKSWYEVFCGEDDSTADEEDDVVATSSRDDGAETQRLLGGNSKKDQ